MSPLILLIRKKNKDHLVVVSKWLFFFLCAIQDLYHIHIQYGIVSVALL